MPCHAMGMGSSISINATVRFVSRLVDGISCMYREKEKRKKQAAPTKSHATSQSNMHKPDTT